MKLGSLAGARAAYYDRNATSSMSAVSVTSGPHVITLRLSTTIASGKKALIEYGQTGVTRVTVATSSGEYHAFSQITISSTVNNFIIRPVTDNTAGATVSVFLPTQPTLYAGEVLTGSTYDLSTGGTVTFNFQFKLTTYDA
jgi:hypothetical protein